MIDHLGGVAEALPAYEIQGELGRGGMGVVLAARHRVLERAVAIKQLPPAFAAEPEIRERFAIEARLLASLSHPHVVAVHDFVAETPCLLVMEQLSGGSVWDRFSTAGVSRAEACAIVMSTCAGLHHAHEHGVLHRDIKPDNVLFDSQNLAKVADFGIAKVIGGDTTPATTGGDILGTPSYMAPEQALGESLTRQTDVYAAGLMLYELLAGRLPFSDQGDPLEIAYRHVHEDPLDLRALAPNMPATLSDATMRAIARRVEDRYATAEDFAVAIGGAAAESFGSGWLESSGMPTYLAERVLSAAAGRGLPASSGATSHEIPRAAATGSGAAVPIRATGAVHVRARPVDVLHPSQLIDVKEALARKRRPRKQLPRLLLVCAALLALTAVVTTRADATQSKASSQLPGVLRVNAAEVGAHHAMALDLSKPIDIEASTPRVPADAVVLRFRALGVSMLHSSTTLISSSTSVLRARVSAQSNRYVVGGRMLAVLELKDRGRVVATREFEVSTKQNGFLTLAGAGLVIVWLVLVSYGEAISRSTRRGRRKASAIIALAVVGGGLGASLPLVYDLAGRSLATRALVMRGLVLGALVGIVAATAFLLLARSRPARKKEVA